MSEARFTPLVTYTLVFVALMGLLALTLGAHSMHWGLVASLGIAGAKAVLVVVYFMHARFAPAVVRAAIFAGVLWILILLLPTLGDYATRGWLPGK